MNCGSMSSREAVHLFKYGSDSTNVDCELEDYLEDELLNIASQNLAMYTENNPAVAFAEKRKETDE